MRYGRMKVIKLDAPTFARWWIRCPRCGALSPMGSTMKSAFRAALGHTLRCEQWRDHIAVMKYWSGR